VRDTPRNLKELEEVLGARLYSGTTPVDEEHPLEAGDQQIAEIVVTQGSPLDNTTLTRARFAESYQLVTLALHRAGTAVRSLREDVGDVRLRVGDILLVQGSGQQFGALKRGGDLLVLDATADLPHTRRAPLALAIMVAIVGTAALGI